MGTCINILYVITLSHMYVVYSTQDWILFPVVIHKHVHVVVNMCYQEGCKQTKSSTATTQLNFDIQIQMHSMYMYMYMYMNVSTN